MQWDDSDRARYESKVDRTGGCHLWTASKKAKGYGQFGLGGKTSIAAHRLAYEFEHGPDSAEGWFVLHHCDNPACVNPAHLWLGTAADNTRDMMAKGRNSAVTHPERIARGERTGPYTHPERRPRGERNGAHTKPERRPRGESHGRAKLTEADVRAIRAQADTRTRTAIARDFGVGQVTVSEIVLRKTWKHID